MGVAGTKPVVFGNRLPEHREGTMIAAGQYAEALRALGRFLDNVRAREVIIVDTPVYVEVSWRGKRVLREERQYRPWELDALKTWARMYRGLEDGEPRYTTAEALRTIGQEFDDMKAELITVVETAEGFWASGTARGNEVRESYSHGDLMAKSRAFHKRRMQEQTRR
jgi:hypothetical protein